MCSSDLVGQDHADVELAELREHGGERQRGEVLELVDIEKEVAPLGLSCVGARECRQTNGRDEESAEQVGDRKSVV